MKKKSKLSGTPRKTEHSRKVHFSIAMREKISKNWIEWRKGLGKTSKRKKGRK
ncbi:hypothetical protein HZA42_03240 [Candidatus Peregrinibacteria bacterium]|nr:hypothetical protein [Candidatus Peregrinibacteria bacterium]